MKYECWEDFYFNKDKEKVPYYHLEWWNHEIEIEYDNEGHIDGWGIAYGEDFDIDDDTMVMYYGMVMPVKRVHEMLEDQIVKR